MERKQATRIQNSLLHTKEKQILEWLAARQPAWVTSDTLTFVGLLGAVIIAAGYILTNVHYGFLWVASLGLVVNWYGDSLDGTLARYRNTQRPIYGYYVDHTVDCINEAMMFTGAGLSAFMHLPLALFLFIIYLMLTINVSINAHLKSEFKISYASMGPTEFRIVMIIVNTILATVRPVREFSVDFNAFGKAFSLGALDLVGTVILVVLLAIYICTFIKDVKGYAEIDPRK